MLSTVLLLFLAQQVPPQPTFKSGVNVVEVDVVVTDKSDRPVRGLRKEDFEIFEDGKAVEVATFSVVDLPAAPKDARIPPLDRSGTSLASNDHPDDGRVILIVLDDYHVSFGGGRLVAAKSVARRVVERLGPSDQAAVMTTSGRSEAQVEFTTDKARLIEAIDQFFPQSEQPATGIMGPGSRPTASDARFGFIGAIKARWAMDALNRAGEALAIIPHRRKAVLLVSQGLPVTLEDIISNPNAGDAWQAMRDFIVTAQRSNIAVYTIDPCGLDLDAGCSTASRQNLQSIAEGTGGFAVTNTNAPEAGVDRMIAENGAYYLIGYYSPAPPYDGKRHRIRVRVREADLEVRAREGYIAQRKATNLIPAAAPLDALISAPIQTRGLTMRVVAIPTPLAARPSAAIVVGIELPASQAVRAERIEFNVIAIDDNGKTRARLRFTTTFAAAAVGAGDWTRTASRIDVPPGRYQIRVAAVAADRTQGSVFTEVTVPKFSGDLGVGGLSLGAPRALPTSGADRVTAVLPLIPLASREFVATAQVAAQLPIRIAPKAAARGLAVSASLFRPDGTTLPLEKPALPAGEFAAASGSVYRLALPRPLAPGDYRLVIDTTLGRAHVTREVAFRVLAEKE